MKKTIICIGREFGAGGRKVAAILKEKTLLPVYDKELLSEAAAQCGFGSYLFKKRDEKRHLFSFSRLFSSSSWNADNYMGDNELFQMQSETIRHIAQKEGSCIIIGRCADYVLRDEEGLVSVFLCCPMEERVKRVCARMDVDEKTAREIIARKDRNRRSYYNGYTLGKWGDAATYDLCIDTSVLGDEGTADLILDFIRRLETE